MCGDQLLRKRLDSDVAIRRVWQQGGRNALYFASRFLARQHFVNCHPYLIPCLHPSIHHRVGTARCRNDVSVSWLP
jgi:hypothetical protein